MNAEEFKNLIDSNVGEGTVLSIDENAIPKALIISPEQVIPVCGLLKDHEQSYFDLLSCLTGIDNGSGANTMEVIYNLYSIPLEHSLMLKVIIHREKPEIETVTCGSPYNIALLNQSKTRSSWDILYNFFLENPPCCSHLNSVSDIDSLS